MEKGGLLKRMKPAAEEKGPPSLLEEILVSFELIQHVPPPQP